MKKYIVFTAIIFTACTSSTSTETQTEVQTENYINYSEEALTESFENYNYTILFFAADWCPTCTLAEQNFLKNSAEIPADTQIIKVDYDIQIELKQQYEITIQHTFIQIDETRESLAKWSGGDIELLKQNLITKEPSISPTTILTKDTSEFPTIIEEVALQDDYSTAKVLESEVLKGCFSQDCIPSIDSPEFETVTEANKWLNPEDIVFTININGVQKAYAQRILNWHEIVNDFINDQPVAITFCPLCGSAVGFERIVNGTITELGVSGKLHNSDLVMYDRFEGNLWQQITGEGIVGPAAERNETLTQIPISTTTWGEWSSAHPDTLALAIPTNFIRDYDAYPYGTYEQDDRLLFGVEGLDESLQIKTVVYGIEVGDSSKAYTVASIKRDKTINDQLAGKNILIEYFDSGEINFTDADTGEEVQALRLFWFSWAAFHPDTELYQ